VLIDPSFTGKALSGIPSNSSSKVQEQTTRAIGIQSPCVFFFPKKKDWETIDSSIGS
jgi:hypothetical protein